MKVLLDTHAFLWAITDDPKLSAKGRELFTASDSDLFLSVASVWEVLTKVQIGKLPMPKETGAYLKEQIAKTNVQVLPIQMTHVLRLERMPLHHRDPFDRILIAQSLEEGFPILTADPLLKDYPAALIW